MCAEQARYRVTMMSKGLEVSRGGFDAWLRRGGNARRAAEDAALTAKIETLLKASRRTYGSLRIHADLVAGGHRASRKRVAELIAMNDIVGCPKRRRRKTKDSNHRKYRHRIF